MWGTQKKRTGESDRTKVVAEMTVRFVKDYVLFIVMEIFSAFFFDWQTSGSLREMER